MVGPGSVGLTGPTTPPSLHPRFQPHTPMSGDKGTGPSPEKYQYKR